MIWNSPNIVNSGCFRLSNSEGVALHIDLSRWVSTGRLVVLSFFTALLLGVAMWLLVVEIGTAIVVPPQPAPGEACAAQDVWCQRLAALVNEGTKRKLRNLNKLGQLTTEMQPTGDVYAMRSGNYLLRSESGPFVNSANYARIRRRFVTAVLTYDLSARLARLHDIDGSSSDPIVRHRALLEIATSIVRADDRGRLKEAKSALDTARRLAIPTPALNADVYFILARIARMDGRSGEALTDLNQAVALDGYFLHAHLERLRLILLSEGDGAIQGLEKSADAILATGDLITILEDRSYLIEVEQVISRYARHDSLLRPFIEAYLALARRDAVTFDAATKTFDQACRGHRNVCPRALRIKIDDLRRLGSRL
jgi:tetratricopeptide (TPR) repeat protein